MASYVYPAIFTKEENGLYSVIFPDLEGCYTSGDNLTDAFYMAEDVLAFTLYAYERDKREIPSPSSLDSFTPGEGSFVNFICCDTLAYQKKNNNRAVKKTLTIPEWLNEAATEAGISFSQALQDALKEKLGLA